MILPTPNPTIPSQVVSPSRHQLPTKVALISLPPIVPLTIPPISVPLPKISISPLHTGGVSRRSLLAGLLGGGGAALLIGAIIATVCILRCRRRGKRRERRELELEKRERLQPESEERKEQEELEQEEWKRKRKNLTETVRAAEAPVQAETRSVGDQLVPRHRDPSEEHDITEVDDSRGYRAPNILSDPPLVSSPPGPPSIHGTGPSVLPSTRPRDDPPDYRSHVSEEASTAPPDYRSNDGNGGNACYIM